MRLEDVSLNGEKLVFHSTTFMIGFAVPLSVKQVNSFTVCRPFRNLNDAKLWWQEV